MPTRVRPNAHGPLRLPSTKNDLAPPQQQTAACQHAPRLLNDGFSSYFSGPSQQGFHVNCSLQSAMEDVNSHLRACKKFFRKRNQQKPTFSEFLRVMLCFRYE